MSNTKTKTTFKTLTSINLKDKIEKKGMHNYLSWSYAWAIVKDQYPDVNRKVYESEATELNFFTDGRTGHVKVGVTIEGVEHIDYLPIMDYNNKSLSVDNITSAAVNKAIQRSTVKAIAMHGLGLSLWAGEDLVDVSESAPAVKSKEKPTLKINTDNWTNVVNYVKGQKDKPLSKTITTLEIKYTIPTSLKKELGKYVK
jgi:hypothetical protein|tara:strand:+ start:1776 stop:2372 length:597 start_codon:yes stop_codon:yes gene_type:complete